MRIATALQSLICFFIFSHSSLSFATATFAVSSGYSTYDNTTSTTKTVIYGGIAGTCLDAAKDTANVCDSCQGDSTFVCNNRSVYSTLKLRFTFKTDTTDDLTSASLIMRKDSTITIEPSLSTDKSTTITANTDLYWQISWGELCVYADLTTDCESSFNMQTLTLGIDKNGDGTIDGDSVNLQIILATVDHTSTTEKYFSECSTTDANSGDGLCHFTVAPGDQKVYLKEISYAPNYPATSNSGVNFNAARLYFYQIDPSATCDFTQITNLSTYGEFPVTTTSGVPSLGSKNSVGSLTNDLKYCFKLANVDQAGNVYKTAPDSLATTAYLNDTQHSAIPGEVFGLIEKQGCFIATAAYGSPMESKVDDFRHFRDQVLLKHSWGKKFINYYYDHSPKYAKVIAQSPILRATTRVMLWPLWLGSQIWLWMVN